MWIYIPIKVWSSFSKLAGDGTSREAEPQATADWQVFLVVLHHQRQSRRRHSKLSVAKEINSMPNPIPADVVRRIVGRRNIMYDLISIAYANF